MAAALLLMALASPTSPAFGPASQQAAAFQPASTATAQATVRIRVLSGVRFGSGQLEQPSTATRRAAEISEADGTVRRAQLLEFQ